MDIKEVKAYAPLMHSMQKCKGNCERNILMSHLDEPSFKFVCRALANSIENPGSLNLSRSRIGKLRTALQKDKSKLRYLTNSSGQIAKKRKIVRQSGEGIGLLLGAVAPALIELVRHLVTKKKAK